MACKLLKEALELRLKAGVSHRLSRLKGFERMHMHFMHQFRWYHGSKVFRPIEDERPLVFAY